MAVFLIRMSNTGFGLTIPDPSTGPAFDDIAGLGQSFQNAIESLASMGLTQGTSDTAFTPYGQVTRVQMALFLDRLMIASGVTLTQPVTTGFTDLDNISTEATNAIGRLYANGITKGTTNQTFDPQGVVTRWQMALFLARVLDLAG